MYRSGKLLEILIYLSDPVFVPQDGNWLVALDLAATEVERTREKVRLEALVGARGR